MDKKLVAHQTYVFILTFVGYMLTHANRKAFSNVKETISEEWTPSFHNNTVNETLPYSIWNSHCLFSDAGSAEYFLGILDTVFMFAYAVGLYASGIIGDRYDMRVVSTVGMCGSATMVFLFGVVSEWTHLYSMPYYIVFWALTALFQSLEWPAMVAIITNWFGKSSRGLVFGLWCACSSVGNIVGSLIVARVLPFGYEYAFLVLAVMQFCWGIIMFFSLVPHPGEVDLPLPDQRSVTLEVNNEEESEDHNSMMQTESEDPDNTNEDVGLLGESAAEDRRREAKLQRLHTRPEALGFFKALCLPGVPQYSVGYACLKFVNYAFFFWIPFYLTNNFGWSQSDADDLSIWFDVGAIIASVATGILSDWTGKRAPVVEGLLILGAPALYIYTLSPNDKVKNAALLAVVGFFLGGPSALISTVVSADLGRQGPLQSNKEAIAQVAGIIDGTGSAGASIGQVLVPVFHKTLGWHSVFYLFIIMTLATFFCVLPVLIREIKDTLCWRRRFGHSGLSVQADYSSRHEEDG